VRLCGEAFNFLTAVCSRIDACGWERRFVDRPPFLRKALYRPDSNKHRLMPGETCFDCYPTVTAPPPAAARDVA
jgi:hypothetical protein